ncbi:MAG: hypothetical protein AAFQ66_15100, partial [Pseudomonadota bacterium]
RPLPVRGYVAGMLQQYDVGLAGFPVQFDRNSLAWLPFPGTSAGIRSLMAEAPDFLPIEEEAALELLERLQLASQNGRQIWVWLDYDAGPVKPRVQRSGPITSAELSRLDLPHVLKSLVFSEDIAGSKILATHTFPEQKQETGPDLPEDVYATTAESLWGAFSALEGGERVLRDIANNTREMQRAPASQRETLAGQEYNRLAGLARETYLIGAMFTLGEYDPARGGFPVSRGVDLQPIAHDQDLSGIDPPQLNVVDREGYAFLPATPEQAEAIRGFLEGPRLHSFVRVEPVGIQRYGLVISRPSEILVGPPQQNTFGIQSVALTLTVAAKPELTAGDPAEVTAPDRLYLDAETADLLALQKAPELYQDGAFARMLIERLAKERFHAKAGSTPPWGAFFQNPDEPLSTAAVQDLLPSFTAWTLERVKALPAQAVLPLAANGGRHPGTSCYDHIELQQTSTDIAVGAGYGQIFGDAAEELAQNFGRNISAETPLPGPDRVFALLGRPGQTSTSRGVVMCEWLNPRGRDDLSEALKGVSADGAAYVDLLTLVRQMPSGGRVQGRPAAVDYTVDLSEVRLVELPRQTRDLQGFKGALVVEATPQALEIWATPGGRQQPEIAATYQREDWIKVLEGLGDNADILGLTLGMALSEFLAAAAERMPEAATFTALPATEPGPYSTATALVQPPNGEQILLATTARTEAGDIVTGIMRHQVLQPGQGSIQAVLNALDKKYGTPSQRSQDNRESFWGAPPQEIDRWGVCGGHRLFRGQGAPQMATDEEDKFPVGAGMTQPGIWSQFGWPIGKDIPEQYDTAAYPYCGPVVSARLLDQGGGRLSLTVWLHDLTLVRELETEVVEEEIELDLEL